MAVDSILAKQYSDNIMLLVQQMTSKLAGTVYQKPDCKGEESYQDQLASTTANEKLSRNEAVVNTDPDYDRRKIIPRYFYKAPLVDQMDKLMMMKDPTNEIVRNNAAALARAKDQVICDAFNAVAYYGKAGTSTMSHTSAQIIVHSTAGLNMVKIRAAEKMLNAAEVDDNDRYLVVTAEEIEDLLAISEVTSSDYATIKALVSGQPGTLCGFQVVRCERLTLSSTTRTCFAYQKTGMVLGTWLDLKASIDILPQVHFSAQIYAGQSYGATRLEEKKVVPVECTE